MSLEKNWGKNYPEFGRWEAASEALMWAAEAARLFVAVPRSLGTGRVVVTKDGYDFSKTSTTAKVVVGTREETSWDQYRDQDGDLQAQQVIRTVPITETVPTGALVTMADMENKGMGSDLRKALAKAQAAAAPLPALREAAEEARLAVGDAMVATVRHCPTYPRLEEAGQILARVGLAAREWELRAAFEAAREERGGGVKAAPAAAPVAAAPSARRAREKDADFSSSPFAALAALKK